MKTLTKLALVSAMAFSANAMAAQLQSLDDAELSATTGQDGISIIVAGDIAADVVVHDKDGYNQQAISLTTSSPFTSPARTNVLGAARGGAAADAGAIVLKGFKIHDASTTPTGVRIHVDAEGGTEPVLNVNIGLPQTLEIDTGDIYVADSLGIASTGQYTGNGVAATYGTAALPKVLNNIKVTLTGATLNLQLGNAPQGAMIKLAGTMSTGLNIANFSLLQPGGAGTVGTASTEYTPGLTGVHIDNIKITSAGDTAWNMTGNINAVNAGLLINGLGTLDVKLSDVRLGTHDYDTTPVATAASIGDVALLGLTVPNIIIKGH